MPKDKWIKPRHTVVRSLLGVFLGTYVKLKYNIKVEKFKNQEKRPYLILYNHQTAFDQFFVGLSFKRPVYYLASEDLFSMGWVSSLIKFLVEPIPIKKQTLDVSAIKTCMRVAAAGGTIAIAPEGNRTFSGKTEYINPSIASLCKKLGLPIVLYRIEGGYGVHPRWSDVVRRGKMCSFVSEVIFPEEYKDLSKEELFERISKGLYQNEANDKNIFNHKKRAEFLERAMYVCHKCGLTTFESNGDKIKCKTCGQTVLYDATTRLKSEQKDFPFRFVLDWYEYQKDYVNHLDLTPYFEKPMYKETVTLFEVKLYKNKKLLKEVAQISLYGNRIVIDEGEKSELIFNFDEISAVTILGKNKLNIYDNKTVYQIKGEPRFNALKYVNIFNHYKNVSKGDTDGKFLGL